MEAESLKLIGKDGSCRGGGQGALASAAAGEAVHMPCLAMGVALEGSAGCRERTEEG